MKKILLLLCLAFSFVTLANENENKDVSAKSDLKIYTEKQISVYQLNQGLIFRPAPKKTDKPANGVSNFFVTPNPTAGKATAYFKTTGNADRLVIRDMRGRTLWSHKITKAQGKIEIQGSILASGTYLVCLQKEGQILESVKLIIK
jgi:hypothetical protein